MKRIATFIAVTLLVVFSYHFLDRQIALMVRDFWKSDSELSLFSLNIPDFLFPLVCVITLSAWVMYLTLIRKGIRNRQTLYLQLVAISVPASYIVKTLLKGIFGRISTRYWIYHPYHPSLNELHWLKGKGIYTGFPSGHMAVFAALALATVRYYPASKTACWSLLAVLAFALVLTDYHFIGDVIAGAYLGFIVVEASDWCRKTFSFSEQR